jgi:ABC-type lipoprotein export system ATPase subunit
MRYGSDRLVLDNLDFEVADGESVAVMGPSGSGKTTMISILGLLIEPLSGQVLIDGQPAPTSEAKRHETRSSLFGWVLQTVNVFSRRSALDNVVVPLLASGHDRDEANERGVRALERVGLGGMVDKPARLLSGGELQRVCIARALAHRPRYLLADEPTGQLDHATSIEVLDALKGLLTEAGSALVVVTHDPEVASVCDRTVELVNAKPRPR